MILARPNFFNFAYLLLRALRGDKIYLLGNNTGHPLERFLQPGTQTAGRFLRRSRNVVDITTIDRRLAAGSWYRDSLLLADIFGRAEEWVGEHYRFGWVDKALPDYAYCFRAMICSRIYSRQLEIFSRLCLNEYWPGEPVKMVGIDNDSTATMDFLLGQSSSRPGKKRCLLVQLTNLPTFLIVLAAGLYRIVRRLKFRAAEPRSCFLMADYIGDAADLEVYRAAVENGTVVLVARNVGQNLLDAVVGTPLIQRHDGIFSLKQFREAAFEQLSDSFRIFRHLGWLGPLEFYNAATFPPKKLEARALLNRFRPNFFYARDCYNYDHILMHAELKRVGAVHLGINVGYPTYTILPATTRYIHFDKFMVFGAGVYRDYYKNKWPDDMEIVSVGSFRAPREVFCNRAPVGTDVIPIFSGVYSPEPGMVDLVRSVAKGFPDKKILLQVKPAFLRHETGRRYIELCMEDIHNIELTEENVYSILSRVKYAITDPSSIIVEAMSFGVQCFLADVCPWHVTSYFRRFDEVIVRSGEEAVEKIQALENGTLLYPWDKLSEVTDLTGVFFGDRVKQLLSPGPHDTPRRDESRNVC